MAKESSSLFGSGISVFRQIHSLPYIGGTNVVVVNPEDVSSALGIVQTTGLSVSSRVQLTPVATRLQGRRKMMIQNLGAGQLYVGNSEVTVNNGVQVASGVILELDVLAYGDIYGVSSATSNVRIIEIK